MRRHILIIAISLPLLVVAPVAAARITQHEKSCPSVGKRALAANAQAEVYEAEGPYGKERFACAYASGRPYLLGPKPESSSSGGGGIAQETLAGNIIAYEDFAVGPNSYWHLVVRNLRSGKILRRLSSQGEFVQDIVVKPNGSLAWTVLTQGDEGGEYAIVLSDTTGTHVVAKSKGISQSSLALAGSTIYWTENEHPASTLLR